MRKLFCSIFAISIVFCIIRATYATTMDISVISDAYINNMAEDLNTGNSTHWWVRGGGAYAPIDPHRIETMVGIDVQNFTSLSASMGPNEKVLLHSIKFFANNAFITEKTGDVHIALGNSDSWDENAVTWNTSNGDYGDSLDSVTFTLSSGDDFSSAGWTSWDVSKINPTEMDDDLLTFYLYSREPTATVTNFTSSESGAVPYLEFEYDTISYDAEVNTSQIYLTDYLTLGDTFSFDCWWEMGQEPDDVNFDVLAFVNGQWNFIGWDINLGGSSTEWQTLSYAVPEWARGVETQIKFVLADLGQTTDPTVYLRNINSAPVPEPTTILLSSLGLLGAGAYLRRRKQK